MFVKQRTNIVEAVQWDGEPHPLITTCSCHPEMPAFNGGLAKMERGDWILTDPETKESWRVDKEAFRREYEVITS